MKAIVYQKYGNPEVLQISDVEKPDPKENEVLIKVYASSVNSWDWDLLTGKPYINRLLFGMFKPNRPILGADVSGVVEAVGKNVTKFHIGEEVFGDLSGYKWGGFAEYVCAPPDALALKPSSISFQQVASLPQAGVLALQALCLNGKIRQGQKILINGCGGGVGTLALQMARSFGAEVTGVDCMEKLDMLKTVGADHVIDYKKQDFTKSNDRYDLILDVVGNRSFFDIFRSLAPKGSYVMIGGQFNRIFQVLFLGKLGYLFSGKKAALLFHKPSTSDLDFITGLMELDILTPVIDKLYSLRDVPIAMKYFGMGKVKGKIVITINEK